ncbi:MAG: glycoside hydrolase family 15 protein [Actinomycetota bacterium]|nr:glycoside hydrolase family 15 protein [Actinomycetota bacterium]
MPSPIESYALLGDTHTAALVDRHGSLDWLCFPRFDSSACFAALLGTPENGRWLLGPADGAACTSRSYRNASLILETRFETAGGAVTVIDFMPPRDKAPDVVRIVRGESGRVAMRSELRIRFDYGSIVPWVRRAPDRRISAVGGPDALCFDTPVEVHGEGMSSVAEFEVAAGDEVPFVLTWHPSHEPPPPAINPFLALEETDAWWAEWSGRLTYRGPWHEAVERSLVVLKALTYHPTGGIVAAPTTSLPEDLGGGRNWDYRYCWLRDATFTLDALVATGHTEEAIAWRDWLLRTVAGDPSKLQIMYGPRGERRLQEEELPWLTGYEGSGPVRIGNAASNQFQLDVYGEVIDSLHQGRKAGIEIDPNAWALERMLLQDLCERWRLPDEGIWEVRAERRHFTHSKVLAWVAFDRGVKAVERFGQRGPVHAWREHRDAIKAEVLAQAWDDERCSFVQSYGSKALDASLLTLPLVGFLPASDERMASTVRAIERELVVDGLVRRYDPAEADDGLPGDEGAFLMCTFWLVDCLEQMGRVDEARDLFERLLDLRNDLGLLAEQYDTKAGRLVGNFPQAFSHVSLVHSARNLEGDGEAVQRC